MRELATVWRNHLRWHDLVMVYAVVVVLLALAAFGLPWEW